ncbi:hypothetical protein A3Q56_03044 [Intoshia linei]|uniref:RING-type domain-containing protein n=1 Tax=Intoshia linei TaxID=1819745 RepID=A0A177B692_9BILA|nr:hypothetical protein A3Q56_03044 [Intoshia linei]
MNKKQKKNEVTEEFVVRDFIDNDKISQALFCAICRDVFMDPIRIPCGHTYCQKCLSLWMKSKSNCPECRANIIKKFIHKDFIIQSIIEEKHKVFCTNRKNGCTKILTVTEFNTHIKECKFNLDRLPEYLRNCIKSDDLCSNVINDPADVTVYPPLRMRLYLNNHNANFQEQNLKNKLIVNDTEIIFSDEEYIF